MADDPRFALVPALGRAEVRLEVVTNYLAAAAERLEAAGVVRRDDIQPLPDGSAAFWIVNPAGIVHLVCEEAVE